MSPIPLFTAWSTKSRRRTVVAHTHHTHNASTAQLRSGRQERKMSFINLLWNNTCNWRKHAGASKTAPLNQNMSASRHKSVATLDLGPPSQKGQA